MLPTDCPPYDAVPCSGEVFRMVKSNPPQEKDFVVDYVKRPNVDWKDKFCEAHGMSVVLTLPAALELANRFRKRVKAADWHVAMAILDSAAGLVAQTFEDPHHTWWPSDDFPCLDHFSVIEESNP